MASILQVLHLRSTKTMLWIIEIWGLEDIIISFLGSSLYMINYVLNNPTIFSTAPCGNSFAAMPVARSRSSRICNSTSRPWLSTNVAIRQLKSHISHNIIRTPIYFSPAEALEMDLQVRPALPCQLGDALPGVNTQLVSLVWFWDT